MTGIWLNGTPGNLPALRAVLEGAGLRVRELPGYDYRFESRQSDTQGFPLPGPWGLVVHHTASGLANFDYDFHYLALTHAVVPVSNCILGMDGGLPTFGLVAAGCSNTNGAGGPWITSRGRIPAGDGSIGNVYLMAIECSIDGIGETWPKAMTDALIIGIAAMAKAYGFLANDVLSHHEWAPTRKIDPAGPTEDTTLGVSTGPTTPWTMNPFRQRVAAAMTPVPPSPAKESSMTLYKGDGTAKVPSTPFPATGDGGAYWLPVVHPAKGTVYVHVTDGNFVGPIAGGNDVRTVKQAAMDAAPKITMAEYQAFLTATTAVTPAANLSGLATHADLDAFAQALIGELGDLPAGVAAKVEADVKAVLDAWTPPPLKVADLILVLTGTLTGTATSAQ